MKIKVNTDVFEGYNKGQIVDVESIGNLPVMSFWRRRLRDAAIDGCCEIVEDGQAELDLVEEVEDNG